jgi:hypothetical protein
MILEESANVQSRVMAELKSRKFPDHMASMEVAKLMKTAYGGQLATFVKCFLFDVVKIYSHPLQLNHQ